MNRVTQSDVLSPADYETRRPTIREEMIALKKRRRISVGPLVTLVFENLRTLRFQIQEMIRVERIVEPDKIQDELDVYNALLPQPGELSATVMIEITDERRVKELLDSFQNFDRPDTLAVRIQDHAVFAEFESGHSKEGKISAVHFVRFQVPSSCVQALKAADARASIMINHEHYVADATVPFALQEEWLKDLEA